MKKVFKNRLPLAAALVLVGIVVIVVAMLTHKSVVKTTPAPGETEYKAMVQLVGSVKERVSGQFGEYKFSTRTWYGGNEQPGEAVPVEGYTFRLSSVSTPGFIVDAAQRSGEGELLVPPKRPIADVNQAIGQALIAEGFQGQGDDVLAKADQRCVVTLSVSFFLEIRCSSPAVRTYLAHRFAPFVQAYASSKKASLSDLVLGPLTVKSQDYHGDSPITASESAGYDIAELGVRNGDKKTIALFYRQGQKDWQYVTEAGDEFGFDCTPIFKNPEARKAFYDQICYDFANNAGQIRVDSNRRALQ